jgi:GST-like protein
MTESAAILIWLAARYPDASLAPLATDEVVEPSYAGWPTCPRRSTGSSGCEEIQARFGRASSGGGVRPHRSSSRQLLALHLANTMGVLDLYVATVSRWSPRPQRFYREAPKMTEVVRRVDADPRLAEFWQARLPFYEGWEG